MDKLEVRASDPVAIATWSEVPDREPIGVLVGNVDLVIVRYDARHNPHHEWVYNGANIDGTRVVWARELDPAADRKLLSYFSDRNHWLLMADEVPPRLLPYAQVHEAIPQPCSTSLAASGGP